MSNDLTARAERWRTHGGGWSVAEMAVFIESLLARVRELEAIVNDSKKWQSWCDHRVLEQKEAAEAEVAQRVKSEKAVTASLLQSDAVVAELKAEVARLTAERDSLKARLDVLTGLDALSARLDAAVGADNLNQRAETAEAEVARLRAEHANPPWKASYLDMRQQRDAEKARADRLETEVGVLQHCLDLVESRLKGRGVTDCSTPVFIQVENVVERLEKLEARNSALEQAQAWQPIETAPKDRAILLLKPAWYRATYDVFVSRWKDVGLTAGWDGYYGPDPVGWAELPAVAREGSGAMNILDSDFDPVTPGEGSGRSDG